MSQRVFSVILLPTAECNVACTYCFENKEPHRLPMLLVPLLTRRLLGHLEHEGIGECEIYWQGGEAMIMGPALFVEAGRIMDEAAAAPGRRFSHYLQTNLISYSPAWNDVLRTMFGGSLGTSMDYPNLHRKLFKGGADGYTEIWTRRLREAQAAGLDIGVIAVLHQGSIDAGPAAFYDYYTKELGLRSFQVNTPFPGGPAKAVEAEFDFDNTALAEFLSGLFDIWKEQGHADGVALGPFDALIHHFTGAPARLPCIWKENWSNQFISIDSKGSVAQCDCWVTSYPETFFGNVFRDADLTGMLRTSPARREFVERPKHLVVRAVSLQRLSEGAVRIRFDAVAGKSYRIASTVLETGPWTRIDTVTEQDHPGVVEYTVQEASGKGRRYYRVITRGIRAGPAALPGDYPLRRHAVDSPHGPFLTDTLLPRDGGRSG